MADYTVEQFGEYLADLLILQYRNEKNRAMIKALAKTFPLEAMQDVINGYDLETAVGHQLDVLGKYIFGDKNLGESRYFQKAGVQAVLSDDDYRKVLVLKTLLNSSDLTNFDVDEFLYENFGKTIRADSPNDMTMTFYITPDVEDVFLALSYHHSIPRPAGVSFSYVISASSVSTFGFCTYSELPNPSTYIRTGFRTYDDLDKEGDVLNYSKISTIVS